MVIVAIFIEHFLKQQIVTSIHGQVWYLRTNNCIIVNDSKLSKIILIVRKNQNKSGVLTFDKYRDGNFIHIINFEKLGIKDGNIQIRLKFSAPKEDPMVLLWVPLVERNLILESNGEVRVD